MAHEEGDRDRDACPWWLQVVLLVSLLAGAVGVLYLTLGGGS